MIILLYNFALQRTFVALKNHEKSPDIRTSLTPEVKDTVHGGVLKDRFPSLWGVSNIAVCMGVHFLVSLLCHFIWHLFISQSYKQCFYDVTTNYFKEFTFVTQPTLPHKPGPKIVLPNSNHRIQSSNLIIKLPVLCAIFAISYIFILMLVTFKLTMDFTVQN